MENKISADEKIAIVGTGAAGLGVLTALIDKKKDFKIVVFDIGDNIAPKNKVDSSDNNQILQYYSQVYRDIRRNNSFEFPPPKTHFAEKIPRQPVGKKLKIFKSRAFGGLTNYWGATMLPLTDREMKGWPIKKEDLYPYYEKISELVGLSSGDDDLNKYFKRDFSTRPAIRPVDILEKLDKVVHQNSHQNNYHFFSGSNRCGLETREGRSNSCVYCGQCLAGCFNDSIYSSRMSIKKYLNDPRVEYIQEKVIKISNDNFSSVITETGRVYKGFNKVFLGAGCPHTTEIVMRSINYQGTLSMADNAVYVFPVFYWGKGTKEKNNQEYISLCNLIVCCVPDEKTEPMLQLQIYPSFEYLWRYNIPSWLWPAVKPLANYSRGRIAFVRMYDHSKYSQSYSLRMVNDKLVMDREKQSAGGQRVRNLFKTIRKTMNHGKFYVPPIKPILQKVNSHYTSTLPYNGNKIKVSSLGEIMKNVFVCDSSVFLDSPAVNPGFTIMANAYRVADKVVNYER
jgi:ferredoxin